jgi:hypothetical protein
MKNEDLVRESRKVPSRIVPIMQTASSAEFNELKVSLHARNQDQLKAQPTQDADGNYTPDLNLAIEWPQINHPALTGKVTTKLPEVKNGEYIDTEVDAYIFDHDLIQALQSGAVVQKHLPVYIAYLANKSDKLLTCRAINQAVDQIYNFVPSEDYAKNKAIKIILGLTV